MNELVNETVREDDLPEFLRRKREAEEKPTEAAE
jgi:hypothetical protein